METPEHAAQWQRIAGKSEVLLRSRLEIAALLQSIVDDGLPLVAQLGPGERLFVARLDRVSLAEASIDVGFSDHKPANAEALAAGSVVFGACHRAGQANFVAHHPRERFAPAPAIRFDFPEWLLLRQRRIHKRVRVLPEAPLHCLADEGGITPFDASIVDIGLSGLGVMVYDPAITLHPGTVLLGCRIDLPDGSLAAVDIEVMHATTIVQLDGRVACRAGCRFIGDRRQIDRLLGVFVLDLESPEAGA